MTVIRRRTIVGPMVIAACALTGIAFAVLPAAAQTTEPDNIGSDGATQADDGSGEPASGAEALSNQAVSAEVSDTALTLRSQGSKFTLEFSGATRRQVVERLLAAGSVTVNWLDTASAEERIEGRHVGSLEEIVSRLLSRTNYIVAYDMSGSAPRMTSVVIHGRSFPSSNEQTLQSTPAVQLAQKSTGYPARGSADSLASGEAQRTSEAALVRARSVAARKQARMQMLQKMKAAAERRRR